MSGQTLGESQPRLPVLPYTIPMPQPAVTHVTETRNAEHRDAAQLQVTKDRTVEETGQTGRRLVRMMPPLPYPTPGF